MQREVRRLAGADNRSQKRKPVNKTGIIVHIGGKITQLCHMNDVSENGALIRLPLGRDIPDQSYFIDIEARTVHHADVAWRRAPRFGLKLADRMSLSDDPQELAYLRAIWIEHATR
jgi:hypothetical protein